MTAGPNSPERRLGTIRWPKLMPLIVTVLAVLLLGYLIIEAVRRFGEVIAPVFIPLLISVSLAYLMEPFVDKLEKRRFSRGTAALLILLLTGLAITVLLLFILPSFYFQLSDIFSRMPTAVKAAANWTQPKLMLLKERSPLVYEKISNMLSEFSQDPKSITEPIANFAFSGFAKIGGLTASVLNLILIPLFVYYILVDFRRLSGIVSEAVPPRNRQSFSELFHQVDTVLRNFVRGQLLVCTAMAGLYVIGFLILGVPMGFTLGILSGFGHLVPYFGTATVALLVVSFTALNSPEWWRIVAVILMFPLVQGIEGFVLTPRILGEKLELHPFIVLVGIILGHHLFGIIGIVLAAPAIACARIFLNFFYQRYLDSDFYQRPGAGLVLDTSVSQPIVSEEPAIIETISRD